MVVTCADGEGFTPFHMFRFNVHVYSCKMMYDVMPYSHRSCEIECNCLYPILLHMATPRPHSFSREREVGREGKGRELPSLLLPGSSFPLFEACGCGLGPVKDC